MTLRRFGPQGRFPRATRGFADKLAIACRLSVCFLLAIGLGTPAVAAPDERAEAPSMVVLTPAPGSAERRAILDALRAELRRWHEVEVAFVVDRLRVARDWAWVETRPQSPDGQSQYEDVSALLRREQGRWRVLELGVDPDDELSRRYPGPPSALLEE
jgi:hypothetical protein